MRFLAPLVFVAAFLGALLVIALRADGPQARADVVIAQRADAFTLDPQRMSWQHDLRLGRAVYECLVTLDNATDTIRPGVAESWDLSPDRRTYTFHLRRDARWSNGDPVTSDDFLYAWRRAILPDTAADYSGFLMEVDGARDYFAWRATALAEYAASSEHGAAKAETLWKETMSRFAATVGIAARDAHTLEVRLRRPVPYFLALVAFPSLSPIHPPTVERYVSLDPATARQVQRQGWTKPGVLVSNGAFAITSWRYKRDMRLERNEYYWNRAAVPARSLEIRIIEDANTTVLAAEAGGIDWITEVLAEYRPDMLAERVAYEQRYAKELAALRDQGKTDDEAIASLPPPGKGERRNINGLHAFGTDFYSFNCRPLLGTGAPNPFADPTVRRAFALAVDKRTLTERVTRLGEPASDVFVPPNSIRGYVGPKGLAYDPVRAKRELDDAGWRDRDGDGVVENSKGERFPTVDLVYSTGSPRYRDVSLALRDMWQSTLGVEVDVRAKETKDFRDDVKEGRFMIARGGWYGDYGDPTTFLELARSTDGNNDRKYASPRYDALLDAAADESDVPTRMWILAQAERLLVEEDFPIVPLCTYVTVYWYEPGELLGLTHQPRLEQYLGQLRRKGSGVRGQGPG